MHQCICKNEREDLLRLKPASSEDGGFTHSLTSESARETSSKICDDHREREVRGADDPPFVNAVGYLQENEVVFKSGKLNWQSLSSTCIPGSLHTEEGRWTGMEDGGSRT
jgi:hypothetical protein